MINPDQYNLILQTRDVRHARRIIKEAPAQLPERNAIIAILNTIIERNFEEIEKFIDEEDV